MRKKHFKSMLGLSLAIIMTGSLLSIGSITTFATEVNGDTIVRTSNRELLEKELRNAKSLIDTTLVGTLGGQYPEEARKNFEVVIENAKRILEDNSSSDDINYACKEKRGKGCLGKFCGKYRLAIKGHVENRK